MDWFIFIYFSTKLVIIKIIFRLILFLVFDLPKGLYLTNNRQLTKKSLVMHIATNYVLMQINFLLLNAHWPCKHSTFYYVL